MSHHAIERARERYGVTLTHEEIGFVSSAISAESSFAVFLGIAPCGDERHAVRLRGRWILFVVGPCGQCVTVLPPAKLRPFRYVLEARERHLREVGMETAGSRSQ